MLGSAAKAVRDRHLQRFTVLLCRAACGCGLLRVPRLAKSQNLLELLPGDCVRVIYSGEEVNLSTVTKIEPMAGCHSPAPSVR